MLKNLPPEGTRVRFLKQVKKAKVRDIGTISRASTDVKSTDENPLDLFYVKFGEEEVLCYRSEIEEAGSAD